MKELIKNEKVLAALDFIKCDDEATLREHLAMCEIPAPSHMEKQRAEYVFKKFQEIGLEEVHMDEVWNVTGKISGNGGGPVVMLAAHTDTVFPMETELKVKRDGERYCCPGINDDTRAVAELFTIARAMKNTGIRAKGDIIFCADVCEEGLGDLKGIKNIFGKKNHGIDAFVSIDNQITGGIVYTATGSRRYKIVFRGQGGHSFADFGIPNPIHALGRTIQKVADFNVPSEPKTTFNVGVINGGTSVNTISAECSLLIDMRSDSSDELIKLDENLKMAVEEAVNEENARWKAGDRVSAEMISCGVRPAGKQDKDCAVVRTAWEAAGLVGLTPELRYESSTDSNIPISMGIPAVTVGRGGSEGGMHTVKEWFVPDNSWLGPQRDLLIILALAGLEDCMEPRAEKMSK